MKTSYLLPHKFKIIGWILLVPATILGVFILFNDFEFSFLNIKVLSLFPSFDATPGIAKTFNYSAIVENNFTNELAAILFITAAILVAFSKEKDEDEFISKIRLESLLFATYTNYAILIICLLFLYDFSFGYALIINMFTLLIVFIIRFNFVLFKLKSNLNEK